MPRKAGLPMANSNTNLHLTLEDRRIIRRGIEDGLTKTAIAMTLGKDKSTIGKEIKLSSTGYCHTSAIFRSSAAPTGSAGTGETAQPTAPPTSRSAASGATAARGPATAAASIPPAASTSTGTRPKRRTRNTGQPWWTRGSASTSRPPRRKRWATSSRRS